MTLAFALPDAFCLTPSRGHTYRPLLEPAEWQHLVPHLNDFAFWGVGLNLAAAPTEAELAQLVQGRRQVHLWNMVPSHGGARVATCVLSTYAAEWHVAVLHPGPWSQARHHEAIGALSSAVLAAKPELREVWTALPLPEPVGAEEALVALNFTPVPNALDGSRRRTYGLFRYIWQAYQA